ncbi:unnamed protein product [Clonostachys rosea]|uniref:Abscisic acid G-protein coupled receptor-like domain-containing protein n=1 Tax=Bionectria ochroleuca TaxID=29856 RepID=A0ABY6TVV3_BIOOC|nr:unnamed protein product [Clonostachys rosea]
MTSVNLQATIGRLNLITIASTLAFHAVYVMPACFDLGKRSRHGQLCASKTRETLHRTLIWLAIWSLELCVGSLYYTHLVDSVRLYAGSLRVYIGIFTTLFSTTAFTPAIEAQIELALALLYSRRDGKGGGREIDNGKLVRRICQGLTGTAELMAIIRLFTSFGALGGNYHEEMRIATILLDFCISVVLLIAASLSLIYFLKTRILFQHSISPLLPHMLSITRHLLDAGVTLEIRYREVMDSQFSYSRHWDAQRTMFMAWSLMACLLTIHGIRTFRARDVGTHFSKSGVK